MYSLSQSCHSFDPQNFVSKRQIFTVIPRSSTNSWFSPSSFRRVRAMQTSCSPLNKPSIVQLQSLCTSCYPCLGSSSPLDQYGPLSYLLLSLCYGVTVLVKCMFTLLCFPLMLPHFSYHDSFLSRVLATI